MTKPRLADAPIGLHSTEPEGAAIDRCRLPVSNHFPPAIRDALVDASQYGVDYDPMARVKAINRVIERAQATHPHLFRNN